MPHRHHTPLRLHPLAAAVHAALLCAALALPPAHAAEPGAEASTQAASSYDIPPGPLAEALSRYAAAAGVTLAFGAGQLRDLRTGGLQGRHTVAAGFARLLAGSGFEALPTTDGRYTLRKLPAAAGKETTLPAVTVRAGAEQESAWGAVRGYVAKRSATATKTNTPIIETPQSISVITRDQMDAQNVQSVGDALRYTAGVIAEANGPDPRADVVSIRGFDSFGRSAYRDGLRDFGFNNQGGVVIETYGLERVEVLRGPSSVLYGQGNAGGTINLVTKRPTIDSLREIQLQYGSFDRKQAAFDLDGPIDSASEWSYRVTGLVRNSETQIDHVSDDRIYVAPALTWRPSAATTLTLLTHYQKNERGQGYQALPRVGTLERGPDGHIPTNRFVGEPGFDRFDQERMSLGYLFEHKLNDDWSLRQNFRWMDQETVHDTTFLAGLQGDSRTIDRLIGQGRERLRNVVIDNQAQWQLRSPGLDQTVLFGVDFQNMRMLSGQLYSAASSLNVYAPEYGQALAVSRSTPPDDTRATLTQTGLYAQNQLKFNDRIAWTIGGRYDTTRSKTVDIASNQGDPQRDHAFTWRTGLVYLFDSGWAPYAGYARSFLPVIGEDAAGSPFKPETGQQFEIGIRYQPKDRNFSLLTSVYQLRRQNVLTEDLVNIGEQVQQGEIRARGIELEFVASLWRDLDLIASYAYNDAEVTRSNGENLGKTPTNVPKHLASLWANWRVPALPVMKVSAGVRYVGSRFGDEFETVRMPSYTLTDAAAEFDLAQLLGASGDWRLALNVSNLFDKRHVATCGYFADGCKYGYRRSAAVTLTHRW